MLNRTSRRLATLALTLLSITWVGCARQHESTTEVAVSADEQGEDHDHSGWWCTEHGIPEDVCTRCNTTLIAQFKEKGDWCEGHSRPDSNCFLCHPELEAKFAARYEARYGEKPPAITDP